MTAKLRIISVTRYKPMFFENPGEYIRNFITGLAVPSYDGATHVFLVLEDGVNLPTMWDSRYRGTLHSMPWYEGAEAMEDRGDKVLNRWVFDLTDTQYTQISDYLELRRGWPNPAGHGGFESKIAVMGLFGWLCGYSIDYLWMNDYRKLLPMYDRGTFHYIMSCTGMVSNVLRIYKSGKFDYLDDELLTTSFRYVYDRLEELDEGR